MALNEVTQLKYEAMSTLFSIDDCTNKGKNYNIDDDALNVKPLHLLNRYRYYRKPLF